MALTQHTTAEISPGSPARASLSIVSQGKPAGENARFLEAKALAPDATARGLRTISEVVAARYYVPPAMLARILREADPVATVGAETVRFEGLSACCSSYIRLDLDSPALDVAHRRKGTVNVDFNARMRAQLAQVRADTTMAINIDANSIAIATDDAAPVVEEKVPLPVRWIKGLGEVQRTMSAMAPAFSLPRIAAQRLLRQLPRSGKTFQTWINASGLSARVSARETKGAVPVNGAHRLRVLEILLPKAEALDVFVNRQNKASAWVLNCGDQRLTLVLNGDPWRGFSGDGGLLSNIAASTQNAVATVRAQLDWQPYIDAAQVAATTALPPAQVDAALGTLAAMGLVGFDLSKQAYFHRVLPFDLDRIEKMNPRLKSAQSLVEKGAVTLVEDGAEVAGTGVLHRVSQDKGGWRCTCPWFSKNGGFRGPCKHILAVEMELEKFR